MLLQIITSLHTRKRMQESFILCRFYHFFSQIMGKNRGSYFKEFKELKTAFILPNEKQYQPIR